MPCAHILAELNANLKGSLPCVYCAVVETRGSTPQKAGAAMLIYPDGKQAGTLGGGCVEAEVKRRALKVLYNGGRPEVFTFTLDDDYGWDDGLICGGRMTILAQPFLSEQAGFDDAVAYHQRLQAFQDQGLGFTEAVVISASGLPLGARYLFDADGTLIARLSSNGETLSPPALPAGPRARPWTQEGIAYLPTPARISVFLVGAGHVAQAVARLATEVGFDVWVLDDREQYASPERFPTASRRFVGPIGGTLHDLAPTLTPSTYALVLTRGHGHDGEALFHLAQTACAYVGMIGSARKIKLIFEDLAARGIPAEALARVHAPLGLPIGSQTVPEIAVSVVAELIACRNSAPCPNSTASSPAPTKCS
jgi:xanthine dehydrogenase accessory factor